LTAEKLILLPVVVHFLMTMALGIYMGRSRFHAVRSGRVKRSDVVNNSKAWPDDVLKIGNSFDNQFQLPMMFYAGVAFVLVTGKVDGVLVLLAWLFVGSRAAHGFVHAGRNVLPLRFYLYVSGLAFLMAFWLWFAFQYFVIG
jgi:hypothetical protein